MIVSNWGFWGRIVRQGRGEGHTVIVRKGVERTNGTMM